MEIGTAYNSTRYHLLNKDTPSLVKPTINHLKEAVSISKDIARKLELKKIEEDAEQMELAFLFSWKKLFLEEKGRLEDYIFEKTENDEKGEIFENTIKRTNDKKINCSFGIKYDVEGYQNPIYGNISIVMNDTKTAAEVCITDSHDDLTHLDELVVKPADNYSNDFNLFEKNKGNRRKRRQ